MKTICMLLISSLIALVLCEFLLGALKSYYPEYRAPRMYQCIQYRQMKIRQTPPLYEILNGESGTLIKYNEIGLPGTTSKFVARGKQNLKIAICGSSFIMGQLPMKDIASSVAQTRLDSLKAGESLFNLGEGNHGPFMSFLRACFFDKKYDFDYVIYINDGNWEKSARQWQDIKYYQEISFSEIFPSCYSKAVQRVRSLSRLINIIVIAVHGKYGVGFTRDQNFADVEPQSLEGYSNALYAFTTAWKNRFVVINVSDMANFNQSLSNLCGKFSIPYYQKNIMKPQYRINGSGHFNLRGNRELGEMIVDVLFNEKLFTHVLKKQ